MKMVADETKKIKYEYTRLVVPLGPVHPALKEPIRFIVSTRHEEIVDVHVRLGHAYRGIEVLAETRNVIQALYLVERICGICSHAHTTCFVQAVEEIGKIEPSRRAVYLRTLIAELERIHSHMLLLGLMAHEIGFDTLFMYTWRKRELVMDLLEEITGNRVHYGMNMFGGVRSDLTPQLKRKVSNVLDRIDEATRYIHEVFQDKTVEKRLCDVGFLSSDDARELCVVGPTARGSGIDVDFRRDDPYAAYGDLKNDFSVVVRSKGDAFSRVEVRIFELYESTSLIRRILDGLPDGPVSSAEKVLKLVGGLPEGEVISRVEAPRGELIHFVKTDGKGGLKRFKARTPTLANVVSLKPMLVGGEIADIPVVIASIDPCISCADRITIVDLDREETSTVDLATLRRKKRD